MRKRDESALHSLQDWLPPGEGGRWRVWKEREEFS